MKHVKSAAARSQPQLTGIKAVAPLRKKLALNILPGAPGGVN